MSEYRFSRRGAVIRQGSAGQRGPAPTTSVRLRRAGAADVPALVDLEQAVFAGDRMSGRQFRHHTAALSSDLIVAATGKILLGYALLLRRRGSSKARVYSIAVADQARGHGLGARLLLRLEAIARACGATEIRLEVRQDNRAALSLYERQGYRRFGAHAGYYEDGADAWRLSKSLLPRRRSRTLRS
jgi:[ribosomal protein S18]-alanine N-acetyltransferase